MLNHTTIIDDYHYIVKTDDNGRITNINITKTNEEEVFNCSPKDENSTLMLDTNGHVYEILHKTSSKRPIVIYHIFDKELHEQGRNLYYKKRDNYKYGYELFRNPQR